MTCNMTNSKMFHKVNYVLDLYLELKLETAFEQNSSDSATWSGYFSPSKFFVNVFHLVGT